MCVNIFDKCYIGSFLTLKKEYLEDSFRLSYLNSWWLSDGPLEKVVTK